MNKEDIKARTKELLKSLEEDLINLPFDGHRVVITLIKGSPIIINVTKSIDISVRKSGITITHDGLSEDFTSKEALLFSIRQIGCERFFNAQTRGKVIFKERPANVKPSRIVELRDDKGFWYVNVHSGINQRVGFLNLIYKNLDINWKAERRD